MLNAVGLGVEAENVTDSVWKIRRMKYGDEQETVLAARQGADSVNHPPPPWVTVWGNVTLHPAARVPRPAAVRSRRRRRRRYYPAAVLPRRPCRRTHQPGDVR